MCGIFGVVTDGRVDPATFSSLGEANTARGNVHFGVFTGSDIYKYPHPFNASEVPLKGARFALGHVRAPTGGQSIEGIHPFETKDLVLAHNGIILNYKDFPHWNIGPVDSQTIIGGIQSLLDKGVPIRSAIRIVVESLDGQQACWMYDKRHHRIYLWRVMSTIYVSTRWDSLTFSSARCPMAVSALKEGMIYCIDPRLSILDIVSTFKFYSPYKTRRSE